MSSSRHDSTRVVTTQHESTRLNTSRHDSTRVDTTQHESTRLNTIRHDSTRVDTTRYFTKNRLELCFSEVRTRDKRKLRKQIKQEEAMQCKPCRQMINFLKKCLWKHIKLQTHTMKRVCRQNQTTHTNKTIHQFSISVVLYWENWKSI